MAGWHPLWNGAPHDVDEGVEGALGVLEEVAQRKMELAVLGQQPGERMGIEGRRTAGRRNNLIRSGYRLWLLREGFDNPMIRITEPRSRHRSCQPSTKPGTSSPFQPGEGKSKEKCGRDVRKVC
jgi:hypothetical protein